MKASRINVYNNYKDSEINWVGKVPTHWKNKRVKDLFVESKTKSFTGKETLLSVSEYTGITRKQDNLSKDEFLTRAASLIGYKICKVDYLVINIMLAWKRGLGISPYDGIVSPSYAVYSPKNEVYPNYFHYLFRSDRAIAEFKRKSTGIIDSRLRLYSDRFFSIEVAIPKYEEQKAIADYLDDKNTYIDKKVELLTQKVKKYEILKLLLINEIVTGGRDESAILKNSNIDWIGKVPVHWRKFRLKDLFMESKMRSTTGKEALLSVSEYSGVTRKQDKLVGDEFLTRAETLVGYKICNSNDLVINIMLAWKRGLGFSPYYGIVSPSYAVYSSCELVYPAYFHYLLRSDKAIAEFKRKSTGIINSRLRLYTDKFYAIEVAIPEYEEQKVIANYLDIKIKNIDRIVENIQNQIDKLHKLRKTLINDVVTGKIRVINEDGGGKVKYERSESTK